MNIPQFLNRKLFDLQVQEQRRITVEEFANQFGAPKSLMTMWMNGTRHPGPKYKQLIIERYGKEAIEAFGEDPRLYFINKNWDNASDTLQDSVYKQMENGVKTNDVRRVQKKGKNKLVE